jgi:hypothetical protein
MKKGDVVEFVTELLLTFLLLAFAFAALMAMLWGSGTWKP